MKQAIQYSKFVIPACPEYFFVFAVLRCMISRGFRFANLNPQISGLSTINCLSFDFRNDVDYHSYKDQHDYVEGAMRTVQMTLDDELVSEVDNIVKKLKTTRSAFARKALKDAIRQANITMLEKKHKKGYGRHPVDKTEFSVWESEQEWGE